MNKAKVCITTCTRGLRICCKDCWIIDCEEDCGKESYDGCHLADGEVKKDDQ